MPAFTIQELVDRAAAAADMHDTFVQPAQWLAWAKVEVNSLDLFMARHGWVTRPIEVTTSEAATPYVITLTNDFLAVIGVWEVRADGRMRRLTHRPYVDAQFGELLGSTGPSGTAMWYSIGQSGSLDLLPQITISPYQAGGTFAAHTLSSSAVSGMEDEVRYPQSVEERIVLGLARRALMKEESDTRAIDRAIRDEEDRIESLCWSRALAEAPKVRNVDRVERGWGAYSMPPYSEWVWG